MLSPKTERAVKAHRSMVRAMRVMDDLLGKQLKNFGLTTTQFDVLEALLEKGPMSQTRLAATLWCSDSNIALATGTLAKRVLVVRRTGGRDRREVKTHLTPQGRHLVTKVSPMHAKVVRAQLSVLSGREQQTLSRTCLKIEKGDPRKFIFELTHFERGELGL
jgi:MarR family 2-MHQ and catechol resistance regulon transcriptional repressor